MSGDLPLPPNLSSWDRAIRAVKAVHERLLRATAALEDAGVAYAVIGGKAVAAWVATVDRAAVRNTPNVDLLVHRSDQSTVALALARVGFVPREVQGEELFFDVGQTRPREALRVLFAGEKVRPNYLLPAPDMSEAWVSSEGVRVLAFEPLVGMKLTSFRRIDWVHLRDLVEVGLVDDTWLSRLHPALAVRLAEVLDDPNG